jgi:hypothetical protein
MLLNFLLAVNLFKKNSKVGVVILGQNKINLPAFNIRLPHSIFHHSLFPAGQLTLIHVWIFTLCK